jgi:hypothetical protein
VQPQKTLPPSLGAGTNNDDVLIGNLANYVLTGGGGHDILTGGAGNDTVKFNDQSDSPAVPLGAGIFNSLDQITDFTIGQDHIDLRGLPNETAGHAPLNLTDHFTGAAGQVVAAFMSDGASQHTGFLAAADLYGDHAADFEMSHTFISPRRISCCSAIGSWKRCCQSLSTTDLIALTRCHGLRTAGQRASAVWEFWGRRPHISMPSPEGAP